MKKITDKIIGMSLRFAALLACSCAVTSMAVAQQGTGKLKLVSYNILEAMKLDTLPGKPVFTQWIKDLDPDIVALQEANHWTQEILEELARGWGHDYVVTNLKTDDRYPVALTSRYPIEVRNKIIHRVSHGAIYAKIKDVNIVIWHLWPHGKGDEKKGYATGDEYRRSEVDIFLKQTLGYWPDETRWLFMGDFNSMSRLDYDDISNAAGRNYEVYEMMTAAGLKDTMREHYDHFVGSGPTRFKGDMNNNQWRIDFIYASEDLLRDVTYVTTIKDGFTHYYSDHYPVYIEFLTHTPDKFLDK